MIFEREDMGRDGIVEASLKKYIWEVESIEDRVVAESTVLNELEWPPKQNDEKANSEKERDLTEQLVLCQAIRRSS